MTSTRTVRSGLILAEAEFHADHIVFHGPLTFDEAMVSEELRVEVQLDPADAEAVADALEDLYVAQYPGWIARLDAERAARAEPPRPRVPQARPHHPCPELWAGR